MQSRETDQREPILSAEKRDQIMEKAKSYNTFDEMPSRDPLWGQNVTCKIFPVSELWFSHNLDFCVWE